MKKKSLHERAIPSEHLKKSGKNLVIMLVVIKIHQVLSENNDLKQHFNIMYP